MEIEEEQQEIKLGHYLLHVKILLHCWFLRFI